MKILKTLIIIILILQTSLLYSKDDKLKYIKNLQTHLNQFESGYIEFQYTKTNLSGEEKIINSKNDIYKIHFQRDTTVKDFKAKVFIENNTSYIIGFDSLLISKDKKENMVGVVNTNNIYDFENILVLFVDYNIKKALGNNSWDSTYIVLDSTANEVKIGFRFYSSRSETNYNWEYVFDLEKYHPIRYCMFAMGTTYDKQRKSEYVEFKKIENKKVDFDSLVKNYFPEYLVFSDAVIQSKSIDLLKSNLKAKNKVFISSYRTCKPCYDLEKILVENNDKLIEKDLEILILEATDKDVENEKLSTNIIKIYEKKDNLYKNNLAFYPMIYYFDANYNIVYNNLSDPNGARSFVAKYITK